MFGRLNGWARAIHRDMYTTYLAARDPRVPWYAKALAMGVAAYALSPIDLIPDFIPVLGYLDDLLIVPLGILLVIRLVPDHVLAELRTDAAMVTEQPNSAAGAVVIGAIWIAAAAAVGWLAWRWLKD